MVIPNKKAEQWEPFCCCCASWLSLYAMQRPSLLTLKMEQRRSPVRSPYGFTTRALVLPESIGWFIEDQAFLRSYMIGLHAHPRSPSRRQLVSLSQSSCELTERRGGGVGVEPNHSLYLHRLAILSVMKAYPRVLKADSGVMQPCMSTLQRWRLELECTDLSLVKGPTLESLRLI